MLIKKRRNKMKLVKPSETRLELDLSQRQLKYIAAQVFSLREKMLEYYWSKPRDFRSMTVKWTGFKTIICIIRDLHDAQEELKNIKETLRLEERKRKREEKDAKREEEERKREEEERKREEEERKIQEEEKERRRLLSNAYCGIRIDTE
jgi:hypothetical protein